MKYRKKTVVVEAIRFWNGDDGKNTVQECEAFCNGKAILVNKRIDPNCKKSYLSIKLHANCFMNIPNGFIITKDIFGAFGVYPSNIFEKTYEKVEEI